MTPFAEFLEEHMYSVRPVIKSRAALARIVGLPKQTVNSWFAMNIIPRPATVLQVAKRLDIPARDLLTVAGYDPDRYLNTTDWITTEEQPPADEVFEFIIQEIQASSKFKPAERDRIVRHIEELRQRYAATGSTAPSVPVEPDGDASHPKARIALAR